MFGLPVAPEPARRDARFRRFGKYVTVAAYAHNGAILMSGLRIGMMLRNLGPTATPALIGACAAAADTMGIDDLWVLDHIAIPPDDAEGSGGWYLDPYATLAYVAACTERVRLGASVFIAPYRPALPTAKWLASIQELSAGRLAAGFGVGWMDAEFRALGLDRSARGRTTDEVLETIVACFAADEVTLHGQTFLFRPRPAQPPLLLGGALPHALPRIVKYGDGWLPIGQTASSLKPLAAELQQAMRAAGRGPAEIIPLINTPLDDIDATAELFGEYRAAGATGIEYAGKYENVDEFRAIAAHLLASRENMERL